MCEFSQCTSLFKADDGVAYITLKVHGLACLYVVNKVVMIYDLASGDVEFEIAGHRIQKLLHM
jgi:hypothetical protein